MKSYWTGVTAALGLGGVVGFIVGGLVLDKTLRKEYDDSAQMMQNAYERHLRGDIEPETPVDSEEKLVDNSSKHIVENQVSTFGGKIEGYTPPPENPYHKAISAMETPVDLFVDGGVNMYGISYLEEEEFQDEDGRSKTQVTFIMAEMGPQFFIDGELIDDWDERFGDSIVVDFANLAPAGTEQVLYVRNHKTEDDYEIMLESP